MTISLTQVEQGVKHYGAFVKAHERVLVIGLSAALLFHFGEKGLNAWEQHDAKRGTAQQIIVKQDDAQLKTLQAQLAAQQTQNAANIARLNAAIANGLATLKQRQQIDEQLPPSDLASRWSELIALPNSVTPTTTGSFTVSEDAAHATVNELEKVPQLTEQVLDTQAQVASCQKTLDTANQTVVASTKELADEKKSHADDVATLKVENKKKWMNGFKWGYIAGIGTAVAIKIAKVI